MSAKAALASAIAVLVLTTGCTAQEYATASAHLNGAAAGAATQTDMGDLTVGDCLNDGDAPNVGASGVVSVPVVDCTQAHDSEVFAIVAARDAAFPAQTALDREAQSLCQDDFAAYVGVGYADAAALDITAYAPSKDSWATGDRAITCVVFGVDASGRRARTIGSVHDRNGLATLAPLGD